ncbi:unnamed protein product [Porites lobata]|uniref:Uncharacterized protein n=1 Tax=Porites lobata TaxID=104759 RepID=A0ABN8S7F1_9CNID|nr:unnamed protein product [Porites lobata]
MRKLLHHGNALKLRREGARLFMLWFQALQENSDELCQLMYACMIPGFPNPIDNVEWKSKKKLSRAGAEEIFMSINESGYRDQPASTSNLHLSSDKESDDWCLQDEVGPIFPANTTERLPPPELLTKFFLDKVLDCMSTQVYLSEIKQTAQVPRKRSNSAGREAEQRMISARDSVLRWFVAFTFRFKRSDSVSESPNVNQSIVSISSTEGSEPGSPPTTGGAIQFSPARNKEYLHDASDVIRKVLFSTRSNRRLLHEVLRQGFLLPAKNLNTVRQVLGVYHDWIKVDVYKRVIHLYRSVV